jgi:hypothetical protein
MNKKKEGEEDLHPDQRPAAAMAKLFALGFIKEGKLTPPGEGMAWLVEQANKAHLDEYAKWAAKLKK